MPELPDVVTYVACLRRVVGQQVIRALRIVSPFVLRTFEPPAEEAEHKRVTGVERVGKRIVLELDDGLLVVIHLMIAGRFQWTPGGGAAAGSRGGSGGARKAGRAGGLLATLAFDQGTLQLVENALQKRAAIHIVRGRAALGAFARGGVDVLTCTAQTFAGQLRRENHTLKRALTDPATFDGIGNAYSDEILHAAQLSPLLWTARLTDEEAVRLHAAARAVLGRWIALLGERFAERFPLPREITAFRPEFAVHGRFGAACPRCGTAVQRIRYAENETNYCPRCQTGGRLLADRSLSRLLHGDWPRTIEELEEMR